MFYLVEECESTTNGAVCYTICTTEEQYLKIIEKGSATFADIYEFSTADELLDWFRELPVFPKKIKEFSETY